MTIELFMITTFTMFKMEQLLTVDTPCTAILVYILTSLDIKLHWHVIFEGNILTLGSVGNEGHGQIEENI